MKSNTQILMQAAAVLALGLVTVAVLLFLWRHVTADLKEGWQETINGRNTHDTDYIY